MNLACMKAELLCFGIKLSKPLNGVRLTGAGPAGGKYFLLPNDSCVDVPVQNAFVAISPLTLVFKDEEWTVLRDGKFYVSLKAVPTPKFYEKTTSDSVPMRKIAVLHGKDCLASTVYSKCIHWGFGRQCKFCGIGLWKHKPESPLDSKSPEQLAEVVETAFKEGVAKHVTLTTGTPATVDKGARLLVKATIAIKERINIPVHVQLEPPKSPGFLEHLFNAGVDTIGLHAESFDEKVLAEVCPMKTRLNQYFPPWKEAVKLFGEDQVSSFLIAGLGESDTNILHGAEVLASLGVIPYLLPLRPILGTALEQATPPSPARMMSLYSRVCEILHKYGLDPRISKAGCVRCGACSALNDVFDCYG